MKTETHHRRPLGRWLAHGRRQSAQKKLLASDEKLPPIRQARLSPASAALLRETADTINNPRLKAALRRLARHGA